MTARKTQPKPFPINLDPTPAEKQDVKDRLLKRGKYTRAVQPLYTDCPNCGTSDHRWLPCPCACHEEKF